MIAMHWSAAQRLILPCLYYKLKKRLKRMDGGMDLIKAGLHNNTSFGAHGMKNWTKKSIDEDSDDDENIQWYIKTSKGTKRKKKAISIAAIHIWANLIVLIMGAKFHLPNVFSAAWTSCCRLSSLVCFPLFCCWNSSTKQDTLRCCMLAPGLVLLNDETNIFPDVFVQSYLDACQQTHWKFSLQG